MSLYSNDFCVTVASCLLVLFLWGTNRGPSALFSGPSSEGLKVDKEGSRCLCAGGPVPCSSCRRNLGDRNICHNSWAISALPAAGLSQGTAMADRCSVERAADAGKSAASGCNCMSSQASVDIVTESLPLLAPLPDSDEAMKSNSLPYMSSSLSIIKQRYFSLREFYMFTPTVAMPV